MLYVYVTGMTQLQHYSSVAACSGYTGRDLYCCVCARTLVHVPGTHHIIHTLKRQTATAVVVLQLLALSAAACLTLYTAV